MLKVRATYVDLVQESNIVPCAVQERLLNADTSACDAKAQLILGFKRRPHLRQATPQNSHSVNSTKVPLDGFKTSVECALVCYVGTVDGADKDQMRAEGASLLTYNISPQILLLARIHRETRRQAVWRSQSQRRIRRLPRRLVRVLDRFHWPLLQSLCQNKF